MEILFQGLICHARVRDPDDNIERDLAVLMGATGHRPILTVPNAFVDPSTTAPAIGNGIGVTCYGARDRVETNLPSGLSTISLPHVPRLSDPRIATGGGAPTTPHPNIRRRRADPKFHAYLELPAGGTVEELDFYLDSVAFNGHSFGCIARTTIYRKATSSNVTFRIRGKIVVVSPNARLFLTNASLAGGGAPAHPHFPEYRTFFDPQATTVWPPIATGTCESGSAPDPLPSCTGPIDLDVDCSNTQFP